MEVGIETVVRWPAEVEGRRNLWNGPDAPQWGGRAAGLKCLPEVLSSRSTYPALMPHKTAPPTALPQWGAGLEWARVMPTRNGQVSAYPVPARNPSLWPPTDDARLHDMRAKGSAADGGFPGLASLRFFFL